MAALSFASGLLPVLTGSAGLFGSFLDVGSRAEQDQALEQLAAQQSLQNRNNAEAAAIERERLAIESNADADRRARALRRAVARQRVDARARGIGSAPGTSGEAILLGLIDEAAEEDARSTALDQLRERAIQLDLESGRRRNLLELTQASERQELQRLSNLTNSIGELSGFGRLL